MKDPLARVVRGQPSLVATHTVLRNTYMLLSLTLLFSAIMAGVAMFTNAAPMNPVMLLVGYIGILMLTSALRNTGWGILCVFALTGFLGYTLGPLLNAVIHQFSNGSQIIMTTLGATGITFLSLSAYVLTSKKDFSFLGGFLFVGLIGLIVVSIIGIFLQSPIMSLAISAGAVLIASGLILFDTSRIINGGETNYIMATVQLYIDIYMLFVNLLHLLSAFSGRN